MNLNTEPSSGRDLVRGYRDVKARMAAAGSAFTAKKDTQAPPASRELATAPVKGAITPLPATLSPSIRHHWPAIARHHTEDVCTRHAIPEHVIKGYSKRLPVTTARQELMYLIRRDTGWSLAHIAGFLNLLDHSGVHRGIQSHVNRTGSPQPKPLCAGAQRYA
jgi:hypothetical protein